MKDNYDLKNPRPNPYAERMKNGYTIIIDRGIEEDEVEQMPDCAAKKNKSPATVAGGQRKEI